jgi:protein SCO1/2
MTTMATLRARPRAALVALALLASCACSPGPQTLPDFTLTNQSHRLVCSEDLRGKTVIVSFVFTRCHDVCPVTIARLVRAQAEARARGLGDQLHIVSLTLDPAYDTPDVLDRYAAGLGVNTAAWDFLTGAPDDVARLIRELGAIADGRDGRLGHTDLVVIVNPRGEVVARHPGTALPIARVVDQIGRARADPPPSVAGRKRV